MPKHIKAVLCDVDGTLIDSFRWGLRKFHLTIEQFGYEFTPEFERRVLGFWGMPLKELFEAVFPKESPERLRAMMEVYGAFDYENPPNAIEGVPAILELLAEAGIVFTILTSRDSATLNHILTRAALDHHFCHIAAEDTLEYCKPDPRALDCTERMLAARGIALDECVLVGDTLEDWGVGTASGILTVIVRTGPLDAEHELIPPEYRIDSFVQLPDWLRAQDLLA